MALNSDARPYSGFDKGTPLTVRFHNDCGQLLSVRGIVQGYEFRGRIELWLSDGKQHRIPVDAILECHRG